MCNTTKGNIRYLCVVRYNVLHAMIIYNNFLNINLFKIYLRDLPETRFTRINSRIYEIFYLLSFDLLLADRADNAFFRIFDVNIFFFRPSSLIIVLVPSGLVYNSSFRLFFPTTPFMLFIVIKRKK